METIQRMKLLVVEPGSFSPVARQVLSQFAHVSDFNPAVHTLDEALSPADAIFVRLSYFIGKDFFDKAPHLKYILSATTGTDHIDTKLAEEKNITIVCLKGETEFLGSIPSTAEHTWALLLAIVRQIPQAYNHVTSGLWQRDLFKGNNLRGKRLGILGLGRVGKQVAQFAQAFGMQIAAYDPYAHLWLDYVSKLPTAAELFSTSDIICIHIPLNDDTFHFINARLLASITKHTFLINTSRGNVWDEKAVLDKLQQGIITVATDVISGETNNSNMNLHPMVAYAASHSNLLITPHIAGATFESMAMTEDFIAAKLQQLLNSPNKKATGI